MKKAIVGVKHLLEGVFSLRLFSTVKNWFAFAHGLLGVAVPRLVHLRFGAHSIEIEIRSQSDLFVVHEVFIRNDYGISGRLASPNSVVIDAGANIGVFSLATAFSGAARVVAFEPDPTNFQLLQKNVSRNHLPNVVCQPEALWHCVTTLGFRQSKTNPGGHHIADSNEATMTVSTCSLADVVEQFDSEQSIVLKMDIEGAEYEVLYNTPEPVFQRIRSIRMEYHNFRNRGPSHTGDALSSFLRNRGYVVTQKHHFGSSHGYLFCMRSDSELKQ